MRILLLASEVAPFAKTGGLADVAGSLPIALAALGHDVRVVMPAYQSIEAAALSGRWTSRRTRFSFACRLAAASSTRACCARSCPARTCRCTSSASGTCSIGPRCYGYDDYLYRFAFFSRAALDLVIGAWGWRPDVVSAHDWHAAPAIAWLATSGQADERYRNLPTVLTIHNLMHQGRGPRQVLTYLGAPGPKLIEEGPDETNFMARGIYHATMVTTVSPTYAREILTPEDGERLDGLLRFRHFDVHGILNGLDYAIWDPSKDPQLPTTYSARTLDWKLENKRALQARLGLRATDVPLVSMVTRLDAQKGLDITGHVVHLLLNAFAGEAQFVILGSGAPEFEGMFRQLAGYHTSNMAAILRYDAGLAPLVYAASDMFLMPSRFEPCGLGQMIAMRYGAVPVVRATGGLVDTVHEGDTGFLFGPYPAEAFWSALTRAMNLYYSDRAAWREMMLRDMAADFSWATSARGYEQVFTWAIARARGW